MAFRIAFDGLCGAAAVAAGAAAPNAMTETNAAATAVTTRIRILLI